MRAVGNTSNVLQSRQMHCPWPLYLGGLDLRLRNDVINRICRHAVHLDDVSLV
jgi:hypothetical protein